LALNQGIKVHIHCFIRNWLKPLDLQAGLYLSNIRAFLLDIHTIGQELYYHNYEGDFIFSYDILPDFSFRYAKPDKRSKKIKKQLHLNTNIMKSFTVY